MGSARSQSGGIGTVEPKEEEGANIAAVEGVGCGRGTRGGVLTLRADMVKGPRRARNHSLQRGCITVC